MKKIITLLCLVLSMQLITSCSQPESSEVDLTPYYYTKKTTPETSAVSTTETSDATTTTAKINPTTEQNNTPQKLTDTEIEGLDNEELSFWFGRQVDADNKPLGALDFESKFIDYDAHAFFSDEKEICLSFDQGYENGYTSAILDTLKEKNVKAIFFLTGHYVRTNKELIKRMLDDGHILGNHGNNHLSLPTLSIADAESELQWVHDEILKEYNYTLKCQRPPAGTYSERSLAITQRLGYKTFLWSFGYSDWDINNQPNEEDAYKRITEAAHNGGIYLLHSVSKTNAAVLGRVIDCLTEQGYSFTVPNL